MSFKEGDRVRLIPSKRANPKEKKYQEVWTVVWTEGKGDEKVCFLESPTIEAGSVLAAFETDLRSA